MDLFNIIGVFILIIIILSLGRILSFALKIAFYVILGLLILNLVFGISYMNLINWIQNLIIWTI